MPCGLPVDSLPLFGLSFSTHIRSGHFSSGVTPDRNGASGQRIVSYACFFHMGAPIPKWVLASFSEETG